MRLFLCLNLFLIVLTGCSTKPTAYVYAKYLSENQKQEIKKAFELSDKFSVELNELNFPVTITESTLLYSLLLQEPEAINVASSVSQSVGFPVYRIKGLSQGNHWYTKNSLALFLMPEKKGTGMQIFKQDLVHQYEGQGCGEANSLTLDESGGFQFHFEIEQLEW